MNDDTTLHSIPQTTLPQPATAFLVVTGSSSPATLGKSYRLAVEDTMLGRNPEAQVRIQEEGISRRHAHLLRTADGAYLVRDLGSTNGTYVNGTRVKDSVRLVEGDKVQLGGQCTLRFSFHEDPVGEDKLREALAAAQVGTFSLDLVSQVISWSEYVERVVGADPGSLARSARPFSDFVHPEDRGRALEALRRALETRQQFDAEFRFVHGRGAAVWVAAKGDVLRDGDDQPLRVVGTLMDVSARKHTEQELRRQALVFESLNDAVVFIDLPGNVVDWNSSAERMFGHRKAEVLGRPYADVLRLAQPEVGQTAIQAALKRYGRWSREIVAIHKDGGECHCDAVVVPLRDSDGRQIASIAVLRDIGERRAMQAQLMVASRMASVGTLAAGVAHEINNPLAFVNANLAFLTEALEDGGTSRNGLAALDLLQVLAETRQGIERIGVIVRDLKAFSRVDQDESQTLVDVRKVLAFAEKMADKELRQKARVTHASTDVPKVRANESRLGQVFLNLLLNAAQAIPDGAAAENEIEIRCEAHPRDGVVVQIRDTGRGIPPDLRARIFDPFFTTKPIGEGTGLGLSICHGIVKSLGGEITVFSEVGEGSTFRVTLPCPAAEGATEVPELPGTAAPARARLLVVDDEPYICTAIQRLLKREHEVTAVTSVREAIARVESGERFDVILSDLMMPEANGEDFLRELKTLAPEQAARMVFMTGGAFTSRSEEFLGSLRIPYVQKPISTEALHEAIRHVLVTAETAGRG